MVNRRKHSGRARRRKNRQASERAHRLSLRGLLLAAWPGAALLLMVAATYWQLLGADFVWDDKIFILQSAQIQEWAGLWNIWLNPAASNELHYWPLLNSSFWLDHKLWGFNAAGFHGTNLLLHAVNAVLLWRLLLAMGIPGAWLIAGFFVVHPVHAEAVAWITARKDLLSTLFYLLAFGCYLRWRGEGFQHSERLQQNKSLQRSASRSLQNPFQGPIIWYVGLLFCYIAAVLSKTVAITLPAALLTWVWWRHGRVLRQDFMQTLPLFAVALAIGLYGIDYYSGRAHIGFEHSFAERLIIAAKALWFYAGKLLWPQPLLIIYPHWDVNPARLLNWLPLAAAFVLAAGLWLLRHRIGRGPLAGALFFAITLSPMLGFADNSYMRFSFAADRYQYLAAVGLMIVLVATVVSSLKGGLDNRSPLEGEPERQGRSPQPSRWGVRRSALIKYSTGTAAAVMFAIYAWLSAQHANLFHSEVNLFRHVVATNPDAPRAYPSLGGALMDEYPEEAVEIFRTALALEPDDTHTYVRLSSTLINLQRYEEAVTALQQAMALGLDEDEGVNTPLRRRHLGAGIPFNLGIALLELARPEEAEAAFRRALQLEPDNLQARYRLSRALQRQSRYDEALTVLQEAAESIPRPGADIYLRMAEVVAEQGHPEQAEEFNRLALAADPYSLAALRPYAATHFNAGKYEEATALYQRILAIAPTDPQALRQLTVLHFNAGRHQQAIEFLQRWAAVDPNNPEAQAYLQTVQRRLDGDATP